MNDKSDGDKPVLTTAPSQSGANYYRPVDSQANEVADNLPVLANASAEQPMAAPDPISSTPESVSLQPDLISPTLETANPIVAKPEDPAKHFVDLPSLSLSSTEDAPSNDSVYVPPSPTMPLEPSISPETSMPTMSAIPPTPPMPPVPTMSAEPIMPPSQKFSAKDSVINASESPAEIAEKMKTANKKSGGQGISKVIMAILLVVVMVVGGWLTYNWYQSSAKPRSIALNQAEQNNSQPSLPTNLEEDKVEVEIPVDAAALSEIPFTSYVKLSTPTANTAEVSGTVCPFAGEAKQGILAFYEVDTKQLLKTEMSSQNNVFTVNIPAGRYLTIFEPAQTDLPNFAYTEYVRCGLKPDECTDHSLSVYQVEAGEAYGQIRVCDPQYNQEGLPASMQFEYDAL